MLDNTEYEVKFFGMAGKDDISDPYYDGGHGERTFVNNIGAAWRYFPENLTNEFFDSQIVCFGGTALVPNIHDKLTSVLSKAKSNHCITLVNTVFDFRNERNNPDNPWPLGESSESFGLIDILIMDHVEALKISKQKTLEEAVAFFSASGVASFIITNGVYPVLGWSDGRLFKKQELIPLPVSKKVTDDLKTKPELKGDTTGCGDNFAGGMITSLAWQLKKAEKGQFDLVEAISWGIASGGHTCFIVGGTYLEKYHGEKLEKISALQKEYMHQVGNLE
jgi:sugar/nucleoside kinase (ribokinase family)